MSDWRTQEWIDHLPRGSNKQKFQYCLDSLGKCLYMRDLQGHSGRNKVEPTLQDTVGIPYRWVEHIYHTGSAFHCNTIIQAGSDRKREKRKPRSTNMLLYFGEPHERTRRRSTNMKKNHVVRRIELNGRCSEQRIGILECHYSQRLSAI